MAIQSSAEMRGEIIRWLRALLPACSANALAADVDSCERFLRSRGINSIPPAAATWVIGVPTIDNHLNQWVS